ncbi:granulysin isoform X2 [Lonchura striata]
MEGSRTRDSATDTGTPRHRHRPGALRKPWGEGHAWDEGQAGDEGHTWDEGHTRAEATAPLPCQGDPASGCWDTATATRCGWEQQCQQLRDSLALGNAADVDGVGQSGGIKCSLCTKVLKKIQSLAGDDPDESAVAAAMRKGCRALGRVVGKVCKRIVNKYRDKISEALQNGETPQEICSAMGICRS